jgi:hypothetical protein
VPIGSSSSRKGRLAGSASHCALAQRQRIAERGRRQHDEWKRVDLHCQQVPRKKDAWLAVGSGGPAGWAV